MYGGAFILYYLTYSLFLKIRVPRDGVIHNFTESLGAPFQDPLPYPLEYWKGPDKPIAVPLDADDDELGFRTFVLRRPVLHEITLLQVCNLELKLNLWPIVFRNVRLDLPGQRTLNFDQDSIFSDAFRGCAEPWILPVLNKTNLVRLSVEFLIIQVPDKGFEPRPVFRRGVPGPLGP